MALITASSETALNPPAHEPPKLLSPPLPLPPHWLLFWFAEQNALRLVDVLPLVVLVPVVVPLLLRFVTTVVVVVVHVVWLHVVVPVVSVCVVVPSGFVTVFDPLPGAMPAV
jgi:hypothetical protein